jgi:hypothetical protein
MKRWILMAAVLGLVRSGWGDALWPACSVRGNGAGGPAIVVNGTPYAPLLFVANNQFGRDEVLVQELQQAAEAGIALFGFELPLEWHGTADQAAAIVDTFCRAHPQGYFFVRVWLGPTAEWAQAHPDDCVTKSPSDEKQPPGLLPRWSLASPSSALWRETARRMLEDRIAQVIHGPHGDRFLGVTIEYLQTGEWFYPDTNDFMDYSPANLRAFRAWLKKTYGTEKALGAAWNDPAVRFESAAFPTPEAREAAGWGPFRDPSAHRAAMDMQRFQGELIAETIGYFAAAVKAVTRRRSLVGVYYGYTMELNENGPRALVQSGHLALGKLLECKEVDLLHAPFSYFERAPGQPGHFHGPLDSVLLHGKLLICEEDTYTHLSQAPPENVTAPGWNQGTHSPEETLAVVRRDFGNAFTHRCGMWIFDLLSDGRWRDASFWGSASDLRRMAAELRSEPLFRPEVAFVVSEEASHFLQATTYPVLQQSLSWWRSELDRIGTPVGYYLQSDLPRLPDSIKVMILADAFALSRAERRAVENCLGRSRTVIWNYAPDIVGPDGIDMRRISERTGIQVAAKADSVPMTIVSEITKELTAMDPQSWRPRFVVTSTGVDIVACYQETGEVSAAARPAGKGVSLYTATPRLPVGLLRAVCSRAGVHLYRNTPGMTGVVGRYLIIHTEAEGVHEFCWPWECRVVERLVPPAAYSMTIESGRTWSDRLPAKTTAIYRCE